MTSDKTGFDQGSKHVLVTGATGFIGVPLVSELRLQGWQVTALVRDYAAARNKLGSGVLLIKSLDEINAESRVDVIINLAGAGIADQRWSRQRKKQLLESRLQTTRALVQLVQRLETRPARLLSASAIGFYGASDGRALDESSPGGDEFTHELCKRWEQEARKAEAFGVKVCIMRLGVVLAAGGGMLGRLIPIFKSGLGGRTGSGQQYLSWIHRDDVLAAVLWLIATDGRGIYNLTAPEAVTNARFSRQLASALHRPAWLHQPAVLVRLMFGEMGERLLLNGQNIVPARLQREGFSFLYPELALALDACV
jgi:uncharacterized protein